MATRQAAGRRRGPWVAIAGTRPNFVKLSPLLQAAEARRRKLLWIHTGQHTSVQMSGGFGDGLLLSPPHRRLRAPPPGPGRIGRIAAALERRLSALRPSLVAVLGDVDSTLAGAIAAWRLDLPLVHVEAGLRSYEPDMPEERNRVLTDALSDRLYVTEPDAVLNLTREGVQRYRIRNPGNVMADALRRIWPELRARSPTGRTARGLPAPPYVVATFHRQATVDDPARLASLVDVLGRAGGGARIVFPVHPRTRRRLRSARLMGALREGGVQVLQPLDYMDFLGLLARSAAVLTDSGGVQVEAAMMRVPCVTLRGVTEHPSTLAHGNELVGRNPRRLGPALRRALALELGPRRLPRAWDGHAAERIVDDWCRGFPRPPRLQGLPAGKLASL